MSFVDSIKFQIKEAENQISSVTDEITESVKVRNSAGDFSDTANLIRKHDEESVKLGVFQQALTAYNKIAVDGESDVWKIRYHVLWAMNQILANGADDIWSGRGNDHQRVLFDARRDAVKTVTNNLNNIE